MNAPEKLLDAPPAQEVSTDVLLEKYAKLGERTVDEVRQRVARALAEHEAPELRNKVEADFLWAQRHGFIAAGRINSAAGMELKATLMNCFVQPLHDSVSEDGTDNAPSIYGAVAQAAETLRRGGGVGFDFSPIRPFGSKVGGTMSHASGPVSYMEVFNASCKTVESAGARRGAQMAVLRVDHPDIERFIAAKDQGGLTYFNMSIAVSHAFMEAVEHDQDIDLIHQAEPGDQTSALQRPDGMWVYRTIPARELWKKVMASTYDHAEPGVLFVDRINEENNLWYCEKIVATNPCGEQPLPAYGSCDLGSLNLTMFVRDPFTSSPWFDFEAMEAVTAVAVRMLDLVLDATQWPLPQQHAEAMAKRRIGLGFLGLGSALVMLGIRYDTAEGCSLAARIADRLRNAAYEASVKLAQEKGAFPLFDAERYLDGAFVKRLPQELRDRIRQYGIRNSHLLSIAPTGTITLAFADNASNGIEPAYSWTYDRKKRMPDDSMRTYPVEDHAWRMWKHMGNDVTQLPMQFVTALEMKAEDHLNMMRAVQPFIDTAISKTVNVPADYPFEEFQDLYYKAWKHGLKGLATYRPNAVLGSILSVNGEGMEAPAQEDNNPLQRSLGGRPDGDLDAVSTKMVYWTQEGKKRLYLTVGFIQVSGVVDGVPVTIERPLEFFQPANQGGDGTHQWASAYMRLLSQSARTGAHVAAALQDLRDVVWEKGLVRCGSAPKADGGEVPRFHASEAAAVAYTLQQLLFKRGFLDADGNQVPVLELARRLAQRQGNAVATDALPSSAQQEQASGGNAYSSRACGNCGARSLRRFEGCERCDNCLEIGSCG